MLLRDWDPPSVGVVRIHQLLLVWLGLVVRYRLMVLALRLVFQRVSRLVRRASDDLRPLVDGLRGCEKSTPGS